MPQAVPTVYGPASYPAHPGNPGFGEMDVLQHGWMDGWNKVSLQCTPMRQPALMETGNPFWSLAAGSFIGWNHGGKMFSASCTK